MLTSNHRKNIETILVYLVPLVSQACPDKN